MLLCIGNVSLRYQKADLGWILHAFDDPVEILSSGGGNAPWHQMYTCTCQIIIMHGRNDFWSNFPEREAKALGCKRRHGVVDPGGKAESRIVVGVAS